MTTLNSAHAVQAAGDLVTAAAELAAGVQDGIYDFERGLAGLLLDIYRDAAAVIRDAYHVARLNRHFYMRAVSGQRLVYGVVDYLIYQMVQPEALVEPMYMPGRIRTASRPSST